MNFLPKHPTSIKFDLWTSSRTLFLLCIVYAVIVDMPLALENLLAIKSRPPTYHFNAPEYAYTFTSPSWVKLGKDALLLMAIIYILAIIAQRGWRLPISKSSPVWHSFVFLLGLVGILAMIALVRDGYLVALIGARAHIALLAFFFGLFIRREDIEKIWDWCKYLLISQFIFSILAVMNWEGPYSRQYFRLTGTFHNPNTLSLFCATALIILFQSKIPNKSRWIYWGATILLVVFTGSRTGIALATIVTITYVFTCIQRVKIKYYFAGILLLCLPFFPMFLERTSGRPDMFTHLFDNGYRLGATWNYLQNTAPLQAIFGQGLGRGSTLLWLMQEFVDIPPVHGFDQLLGIELVQGGLLLLTTTLLFIISPLLRISNSFLSLVLPGVVLGASIALPVWEAWPANIILISLYGYASSSIMSQ